MNLYINSSQPHNRLVVLYMFMQQTGHYELKTFSVLWISTDWQLTSGMCCLQVLKWSDYCLPLACSPGQPFRAVAQASVDNFSRLGVAFIEDRLQLDNGLMPTKIVRMLPSITFHIYPFLHSIVFSYHHPKHLTYVLIDLAMHIQ